MYQIVWSDDLSVGVEQIDNDHKELIAILNKMINEVGKNKELLMQHFDELEDYTYYHFEREEQLMISQCLTAEDRIMVKEHIKEHKLFTNKIPELKKKIQVASSSDVSFETIDFLVNWLLDHIIVKDLSLSQCFTFNQPSEKRKISISALIEKINEKLSLYNKVFLLVAIPILVVFGLSFYQSSVIYNEYVEVSEVEDVTQSYIAINALINSLQKERGYSNGWVVSKYTKFKQELYDQRIVTSELIDRYTPRLEKLKKYVDTASDIRELNIITTIRTQIDSGKLNTDEVNKYYTDLIDMNINIIKSSSQYHSGFYTEKINAPLIVLLYLKENSGVLRHLGLQQLLLPHQPLAEFKKHIIIREGYKRSLYALASERLLKKLKKIDNSTSFANIKEMEKNIIENSNHPSLTGSEWFKANSIKIDTYSQVIKDELEIINSSAKHKKKSYLFYMAIFWSFLLVVLFFSSILMYALRQSIVHPVEEVTMAMQNLTKGNRAFYFNTYRKDDLIGKMVVAFNNLRRYMIKSDYTEALLDIKDEKVNKYEKLSYVDPLTGIFNRRKYINSLKIEIEKSSKSTTALSLLVLDLDRFKFINDSFGHDVGDHILKAFATSLKHVVKDNGIVTRIGGEEFAVILPSANKEKAMEISEKILKATKEIDFTSIHRDILLSVSIGISTYKNSDTADLLMKTADEHLYKAKHTGRDRVCC